MDIYLQVVLFGNLDEGPVSQKVARILADLDLYNTLTGKKGTVHLPRGTYAGSVTIDTASAKEAITAARTATVEGLSAVLEDTGFRGSFFVVAAQHWCWGIRPVPHTRKNAASDSSREFPVPQKSRTPYPFVRKLAERETTGANADRPVVITSTTADADEDAG